jgi:hypothetical protein
MRRDAFRLALVGIALCVVAGGGGLVCLVGADVPLAPSQPFAKAERAELPLPAMGRRGERNDSPSRPEVREPASATATTVAAVEAPPDRYSHMSARFQRKVGRMLGNLAKECQSTPDVQEYFAAAMAFGDGLVAGQMKADTQNLDHDAQKFVLTSLRKGFRDRVCSAHERAIHSGASRPQCATLFKVCHETP